MATNISDEAKQKIKEIWLDVGEDTAILCVDKLIETFDILANDTGNAVAKVVVASLRALQPIINELLDLINGKDDN